MFFPPIFNNLSETFVFHNYFYSFVLLCCKQSNHLLTIPFPLKKKISNFFEE